MNKIHIAIVIGALISCFSARAIESEVSPTNVEVLDNSEDTGGARIVYKVKELIRKSSSMTLTAKATPRLVINISTMAYGDSDRSYLSIYSVIWTIVTPTAVAPFYANSTMGYVGASRVGETAENIVAITDKMISGWKREQR